MAIKTAEEILNNLNTIIGENATDDALTLMEDISDTLSANQNNDMQKKLDDLQKKYDDNDKAWRDRYRERFLSGNTDLDKGVNDNDDNDDPKPKSYKYEDLFKEG